MVSVIEERREVTIAGEYDVIVAGGGIAGMIAAIAAARIGARVTIIDRFGSLGGNMGPGMWAGGSLPLALAPDSKDKSEARITIKGMGGIPEEPHIVSFKKKRRAFSQYFMQAAVRQLLSEWELESEPVPGFLLLAPIRGY